MPKVRWLLCSAAVAVMAGYAVVGRPHEPFGDGDCAVDAVMVLNPNPTTYQLDPPFRVLRDGGVTLSRPDGGTAPAVRVDLRINGEHVIVFARPRQ
jgi:hypothetical protein